jgi:hypothetical protein
MDDKNYDIHSEEELKAHAAESERIADQYATHCSNLAEATIFLARKYVEAIKAGKFKDSVAVEKAYILLTDGDDVAGAMYETYVQSEMLKKGLEKVLEARMATRMLHQSLMKNRTNQGA